MKKIYTLIAAAVFTFGANAQYDLSIDYTAYDGGEVETATGIDLSFSVTNEGDVALEITDTIWVSYTRDGTPVNVTNVNVTGAQYIALEEPLAPGASVGPYGPTSLGVPSGFNEDFCAVVYGVGVASLDETNDDNYTDNVMCIEIDVETGFDVSIEENEFSLSSIFVNAGNLMIVNEGTDAGKTANVSIVNISGQTVQSETVVLSNGTNTVALNNLSNGIYLVAIEVEGAVITRKVSVQ
jgi:hypothetical protein